MPYLFIKLAINGGFTPISLVWLRLVIAAAILLVLAARAGTLKQISGHWKPIFVYAIVEVVVPFPMLAIGETHIASSMAAIVIACVPLLVALFALGFGQTDRMNRRQVGGLLIGLVGVVFLVGLDASSSSNELLGVGAVFVTAVGYALGPLVLRNYFQDVDARASMAVVMAIAAVLLTPWAAFDLPAKTPTLGGFGAVVVLAVLCSALAFVLMALLVREIGAPRAVVITYVNPVIALILGTVFLSETPGVSSLIGLVLILLGSWASATQSKSGVAGAQPTDPITETEERVASP
jgi:drug/metabolite transporter (DMT)-like permease